MCVLFANERNLLAVVDDVSALIEKRLKELHGEQTRLRGALAELSDKAPAKRSGGARGSSSGASKRARPRRSKKGGTRVDHAVAFVEKNPGSTTKQIAEGLKVQPAYLYRVLPGLVKEGRLKKDGRAYTVAT